MSVTEAKADTMRLEREVAEAFPAEEVTSVEQAQDGVLLACSDDRYQWTGRIKIGLDGSRQQEDVIELISGVVHGLDGYSSELREEAGAPWLLVSGPGGSGFVGRYDEDMQLVNVATASRCVTLADDESPFDTF